MYKDFNKHINQELHQGTEFTLFVLAAAFSGLGREREPVLQFIAAA